MNDCPVISLVLHGHAPFVCHPEQPLASQEHWLFESISETYIPLLEVFENLDKDHIPFRIAISLSPTLCHMLSDEFLIHRYLEYVERQIEFGEDELNRCADNQELRLLVKKSLDTIIKKKTLFTERYEKNILKGFDHYQRKGRLEIMATAATHAFLPFYTFFPEAIQAQFEVAISTYRNNFDRYPAGFWLPEMGWKEELDQWLRSYNFSYTIVDSHALFQTNDFPKKGNFYPVRTPQGIAVFARDFYAASEMADIAKDPVYRFPYRDQGFELPHEMINRFLSQQGSRNGTGYKYWAYGDDLSGKVLYNPERAREKAYKHARYFIENRLSVLKSAKEQMDVCPMSLCAFEADSFGRFWHEGPEFIEAFFREGAKSNLQFMTPAECLSRLDSLDFQNLTPAFSSWGNNGYAETWLDASNDWMYRHAVRALDRMVEIAERFPNNSGLKERALNQAAREILLVLSSDWSKMLYRQENADYAWNRIVGSLRNFTTIYEALGSNYISTEWLTQLERRHNVFPNINYRVFRRKR